MRTSTERSWEKGFEHLESFIAENGLDALNGFTVCDDGYKLEIWLRNCKAKYCSGKMPELYAERFRKLGITLEKKENPWNEHFEELKYFIETHRTARIPKSYITESGIKLFQWLADQKRRYKKGQLSEEYVELLRSIGVKI